MARKSSEQLRLVRKERIRKKVEGTVERPRFAIFRSSKYIYAQIIDDVAQKTIVSCSSTEKDLKKKLKSTRNLEAAKTIGATLAQRAKEKKITAVVFDRSGYVYHGRVKALADSAREAGLQF